MRRAAEARDRVLDRLGRDTELHRAVHRLHVQPTARQPRHAIGRHLRLRRAATGLRRAALRYAVLPPARRRRALGRATRGCGGGGGGRGRVLSLPFRLSLPPCLSLPPFGAACAACALPPVDELEQLLPVWRGEPSPALRLRGVPRHRQPRHPRLHVRGPRAVQRSGCEDLRGLLVEIVVGDAGHLLLLQLLGQLVLLLVDLVDPSEQARRLFTLLPGPQRHPWVGRSAVTLVLVLVFVLV